MVSGTESQTSAVVGGPPAARLPRPEISHSAGQERIDAANGGAVLGSIIKSARFCHQLRRLSELKPRARVEVDIPVVVDLAGATVEARVVNLGLGGAFIQAMPPPPYGTRLFVAFELADLAGPCRLPAIVRWSNLSGFGVQFLELGARETYALGRLFVASHNEEGGPPTCAAFVAWGAEHR